MVNTRSSPKWAEIVTIRGRAEWLDVPRHQRFQRRPVAMKQSDRERTEAEPLTDLILTFSTPPNSVSSMAPPSAYVATSWPRCASWFFTNFISRERRGIESVAIPTAPQIYTLTVATASVGVTCSSDSTLGVKSWLKTYHPWEASSHTRRRLTCQGTMRQDRLLGV